jgi:hypothetical protein
VAATGFKPEYFTELAKFEKVWSLRGRLFQLRLNGFGLQEVEKVAAVTQVPNVAAQWLYQAMSFRTDEGRV